MLARSYSPPSDASRDRLRMGHVSSCEHKHKRDSAGPVAESILLSSFSQTLFAL
jgi:hypothetical protein